MRIASGEQMAELKDFDNEFSSPATLDTPAVDATVDQPSIETAQKFRREIVVEGGGTQVFEAESLEALVDKLTEAQTNATKKIREQAQRIKLRPERDTEPIGLQFKPRDLTLDQKFALSQRLQEDPDGAFEEMLEARFDIKSSDLLEIKEFVQTAKATAVRNEIDSKFLQDHSDDYTPTPENASAIINFLRSENLPYTNANLDYALQELTESGLLEVRTNDTQSTTTGDDGSQRIAVKPHTRTKPLSTGIRNTVVSSQRKAEEITTESSQVEADVKKIFAEPDLDKARTLMLAAMARKSSSR